MKELIFWGSYIYFPFAFICVYAVWRGGKFRRALAFAGLTIASVIAYARFIEPQILHTVETDIDLSAGRPAETLRIAVVADMHYGIFANSIPMDRLARRVNSEKVDAVFIPGDFVYHLPVSDFDKTFAAIKLFDAPVYAVLGNHDVGFPGPDVSQELAKTLQENGVILVENRAVDATIANHEIQIAGVSDIWQQRQSYASIARASDKPRLLLAHNPDTAYDIPAAFDYDLMISGHTHGGQVRLPGMLRRVIPTRYPFDKGLHTISRGAGDRRVFVTPGTGMVGLAMRFRMPPRIDVLNLIMPED